MATNSAMHAITRAGLGRSARATVFMTSSRRSPAGAPGSIAGPWPQPSTSARPTPYVPLGFFFVRTAPTSGLDKVDGAAAPKRKLMLSRRGAPKLTRMFDQLSDRLQGVLSDVRSRGRLSEDDVDKALREVRLA